MADYDFGKAASVMEEVAGIGADRLFSGERTERVFWAKSIIARHAKESGMSGRSIGLAMGCVHSTIRNRLLFYENALKGSWRYGEFFHADRLFRERMAR